MQLFDRTLETSETTGTGDILLQGAITGFSTFASALPGGGLVYYTIVSTEADEWECGIAYEIDEVTLERRVILSNSAQTTSPINFSAGLKRVFCDPTALACFNQIDHLESPRSTQKQAFLPDKMLWGDGFDGDLTHNSDTLTLDSPKYYNNLTLNGGTIAADGYRIHAKTIIINSGSINANGLPGLNGSLGSGGAAPAAPSVGEFNFGIGNIASGRGTAGTLSGAATAPTAVPSGDGGDVTIRCRPPWMYWLTAQIPGGGTGGIGGVGSGGGGGGSGGNGGGRLVIIAETIINNGTISALGGNGGTGNGAGASGSGGSGGLVYIICRKYLGNLPTVLAGTPGSSNNGNFIIYSVDDSQYRVNQ